MKEVRLSSLEFKKKRERLGRLLCEIVTISVHKTLPRCNVIVRRRDVILFER